MKKTLIALTLATTFAAPAMAKSSGVFIDKSATNESYFVLKNNKGDVLGYANRESNEVIKKNADGSTTVIGAWKTKGEKILITDGNENYAVASLGGKNDNKHEINVERVEGDNWNPDSDMNIPETNLDQSPDNSAKPDQDGINQGLNDSIANINKNGTAAYEQGQRAYADIDGRVNALEVNFDNFKAETERKFKEMDQRLDATNASLHAVTNARPMVSNGQTAFGVGTGFAGSAQAIAVGVAHSFEDSGWSASATINQTTGGYSEFNGGAGVQYAF